MKKPKNLPPINAAAEYKIRLADPETLNPYDKNPRLISQAAIDKVLASPLAGIHGQGRNARGKRADV